MLLNATHTHSQNRDRTTTSAIRKLQHQLLLWYCSLCCHCRCCCRFHCHCLAASVAIKLFPFAENNAVTCNNTFWVFHSCQRRVSFCNRTSIPPICECEWQTARQNYFSYWQPHLWHRQEVEIVAVNMCATEVSGMGSETSLFSHRIF